MSRRFNPPPTWPRPEPGWTPPPGWQPDPSWGPVPEGWELWVDDDAPGVDPAGRPATGEAGGSTAAGSDPFGSAAPAWGGAGAPGAGQAAPTGAWQAPTSTDAPKPWYKKVWPWVLLGLALLLLLGGLFLTMMMKAFDSYDQGGDAATSAAPSAATTTAPPSPSESASEAAPAAPAGPAVAAKDTYFDKPAAPGTPVAVPVTDGNIELTVNELRDVTDEIAESDDRQPSEGNRLYIANVTATYRGTGEANAFLDIAYGMSAFNGTDSPAIGQEVTNLVVDQDLFLEPAMSDGESVTGNVLLDGPAPDKGDIFGLVGPVDASTAEDFGVIGPLPLK